MGHELPTHPTLFAKFREALIGAHDDIVLPASSDQVDWEAELALVIGTRVAARDADGSGRRDRRVHRRQRRLDARLAVPLARVPPGQDLGALDARRSVAGDARRGRWHRTRSRDRLRGRRRHAPGEPHVGAGLLVGRPRRLRERVRDPSNRATCCSPARPRASGTACSRRSTWRPGRWSARSSATSASSRTGAAPRRPDHTTASVPIVTSSHRSGRPISPPWPILNPPPSVPKTWVPACAPCASCRASRRVTSPRSAGLSRRELRGRGAGRQASLARPAARARRRARRRPRRARRRRLRG